MNLYEQTPSIVEYAAADATVKFLALSTATDRHQLLVTYAAAGDPIAVAVSMPPKADYSASVPKPDDVAAEDWIPLASLTTSEFRLLALGGRYLRFTPDAGGPATAVKIACWTLPPTSK